MESKDLNYVNYPTRYSKEMWDKIETIASVRKLKVSDTIRELLDEAIEQDAFNKNKDAIITAVKKAVREEMDKDEEKSGESLGEGKTEKSKVKVNVNVKVKSKNNEYKT